MFIMQIKRILLGGFLGLLAAVLSTPVNAIGLPDKDTVQEALKDGYILVTPTAVSDSSAQSSTSIITELGMDHHLPLSLTELDKNFPTIKASRQIFTNVMEDGSADYDESGSGQFTTTESSISYTPTSAYAKKSVTFSSTTAESSKMSMTIQTSQQPFTSFMEEGSAEDESGSGHITATDSSTSHTTTTTSTTESTMTKIFGSYKTESSETSATTQTSQEPSTAHIIESSSETTSPTWVHGQRRIVIAPERSTLPTPTSTTASVKDEITASPESQSTTTSQALLVPLEADVIEKVHVNNIGVNKVDSDATSTATQVQSQNADKQKESKFHKGHSTPGWIIILGFVVGIAALVALCAAIATREKWNGPNQALETKTNQKRELETQAFLYKEEPKENGKAAEYTVIPLDDLPEGYSLP